MNRIELSGIAQSEPESRQSDGTLAAMLFMSMDRKGNRIRVMAVHSPAELLLHFKQGERLKVTGCLHFLESGELVLLAETIEPLSGPETVRARLAKVGRGRHGEKGQSKGK